MPQLTDLVSIPDGINPGLDDPGNRMMLSVLGNPRSHYSANCQPVTNPGLAPRMITGSVGPFRVTGLDKAVESLKSVMANIKSEQPNVFAVLGTAGMLCVRFVTNSTSSISNHSWGCAVDLKINGILDQRGDNKVQFGLTLIAPIFARKKWFWGAGFHVEDGMHFEVSKQLLTSWSGMIVPPAAITDVLTVGDRTPKVAELQHKLNLAGENLHEDGIFGSNTHAAVIAFQAANGLVADGVVGPETWAKLNAL